MYTEHIEKYDTAAGSQTGDRTIGVWALFKQLRQYALTNDQILLLIEHKVMGMPYRQIRERHGWLSTDTVHRHLNKALTILKKQNFAGGKDE